MSTSLDRGRGIAKDAVLRRNERNPEGERKGKRAEQQRERASARGVWEGKTGEEQQMGDRHRRKSPEEMNEWVKGEGESIETE